MKPHPKFIFKVTVRPYQFLPNHYKHETSSELFPLHLRDHAALSFLLPFTAMFGTLKNQPISLQKISNSITQCISPLFLNIKEYSTRAQVASSICFTDGALSKHAPLMQLHGAIHCNFVKYYTFDKVVRLDTKVGRAVPVQLLL